MKTKRTNRLIALILVVVMLVPMISISATAWDIPSGATVYLKEDFNAIVQEGDTIQKASDTVESKVIAVHKYSKLIERAAGDNYLQIPYKGISKGLRLKLDEDGNQVYEDAKDENGMKIKVPVMVPFLDENGNEVKDADGNVLMVQDTEPILDPVMVDKIDPETGEPVTDIWGNVLQEQKKDEAGNPVTEVRMELAYKYAVDEYGRPLRQYDEIQSNGTYGSYVYELDADGNKILEYTDEPILDADGNPRLDKDGNIIYAAKQRPAVTFKTGFKQTEAYEEYSEGNPNTFLKLDNQSISSADQGVILQLDVYIHYDYDLDETNCGYDINGKKEDPIAEIQLAKITHSKINNSTSTSNISIAKINLRTGVMTNMGDQVPGAANLKQDTWYTIQFEIDLTYGTYTTYVITEEGERYQYGLFGSISTDNVSKGLINIGVDSAQLVIAKCIDGKAAYDNVDTEAEDMSFIGVDNVSLYKNDNYVAPEEIYEPEIQNKISGETFNTRQIGMAPKSFGYKSAPATARIVADPTDPEGADRAVRVDFRGYRASNPDGYCVWATTNDGAQDITDWKIDENGVLTGKTSSWGKVSGKIWGDDEIERNYRVNCVPNPDYATGDSSEQYLAEYKIDTASVAAPPAGKTLYIVTSEFLDAMYGGSNVAASFSPGNPMMNQYNYGKVALQVKYYLSADAVGNIEMQMNGPSTNGSNGWIDTVRVNCYKDGTATVSYGQNYKVVSGAAAYVNREEWFTVTVVFDLETHWEDIFLNGDYLYTLKPAAAVNPGSAVTSNSWSIGKPIRNNVPGDLDGYYLVDDVMIFNSKGIIDDIYNKASVENFDDLTAESDLTATDFATNMPSSVVFYDDTANGHATTLKMDMSLDVDLSADKMILWCETEGTATYEEYQIRDKNDGTKSLRLNGKAATNIFKEGADYNVETGLWELKKDGETFLYKETTYAEYAMFYCLGNNANQKWTFANPGLSAATNTLIAADFELFVPEGNGGIIQGNLKVYSNGKKKVDTGLPLYSIDTGAGTIGVGASTEGGTLNVGEWNNISAVINLKTGEVSIFVNNAWAVDGQLEDSNLSFMRGEWIPAMLAVAPGEAASLAGYVLLDDVRMFSVTDELIIIDETRENMISATFKGEPVQLGDKFFVTDDADVYEEELFDVEEYDGLLEAGSMKDYELLFRNVDPTGLRFTAEVDEDMLDELIEEYGEENVTVGMILVPADFVSGWDRLTIANLDAANIVYQNVLLKEYYDDNIMAASIANIKQKNANRDFRAMAYVEVVVSEFGTKATICSDLMTANIAKVAVDYLDENDDLDEALLYWVEYYASFYRGK